MCAPPFPLRAEQGNRPMRPSHAALGACAPSGSRLAAQRCPLGSAGQLGRSYTGGEASWGRLVARARRYRLAQPPELCGGLP